MRKCPVTDHTSMILKLNELDIKLTRGVSQLFFQQKIAGRSWPLWACIRGFGACALCSQHLDFGQSHLGRSWQIWMNSGCCARGERIWFFMVPFTAVYVIYILHFPKAAFLIFSGSPRNQKEVHCQHQGILGLVRIVTVLSSGAMSILLRILAKDMGCFCQAKLFWLMTQAKPM